MEEATGAALFQRTRDGFVLTDEGQAMFGHAVRMEDEALSMQRELAGSAGSLEGFLRLSCSDWFATTLLAPVLAEFAGLHPKVTVELLTDTRIYSLAQREADLVMMDAAFGGMPDVGWARRILPNATIVSRSNSREVQARLCALGAVLPRPLGDGTPGIALVDLGEQPPAPETWIGYHRDLRRLPRPRALLDVIIARIARD
ncbi:LysR family transcriptional regulator [Aquabacter sp. CN5-332]|uniref:LysR family transcriptional regulator n=1 Tax=Aquabacter sp. CN5-332 TaxID=3156608 RepID=UPI0032B5C2B2